MRLAAPAMSQQDVEIVRRALTAGTARPPDFETINALYDPEHVLITDWGVEGSEYRGARGFAELIADLDEFWQEWRQQLEDVLDAGDQQVVALIRFTACGRESGAPVDQAWAQVEKLHEGKLIASRGYLDRGRALQAAGLVDWSGAG